MWETLQKHYTSVCSKYYCTFTVCCKYCSSLVKVLRRHCSSLLRSPVLACHKLAMALFSLPAVTQSVSNVFIFSLLMKMKKETQLPYYKIAFLLIFVTSSVVLWLVWKFSWVCFAFFPICTSCRRHLSFFSTFVFLVEAFSLATSDRTATLAEFPAGSKYVCVVFDENRCGL